MVSRKAKAAYHGFTFRTHSNRPYRPAARPGRPRLHGPTVARHSQGNAPMAHGCVSGGVRRVSWVLLGRRGHFAMVFTGVKCPCLAGRDGGLGRMPGMPGYPGGIGRRHGSFRIMRRSRPETHSSGNPPMAHRCGCQARTNDNDGPIDAAETALMGHRSCSARPPNRWPSDAVGATAAAWAATPPGPGAHPGR